MTRPIARVLLFPLAMAALLVGIYTAAMHAPTPHHLKITVAGPSAQTEPLAASLRGAVGDAYDVSTVTSTEQARQLVAHRAVAAAYVPTPTPDDRNAGTAGVTFAQPQQPDGPVLYIASPPVPPKSTWPPCRSRTPPPSSTSSSRSATWSRSAPTTPATPAPCTPRSA
ncbi:hypothetical protein [Streptomyces aureus]|uniref:hypothetical protein n=1 Tax=Streptomyces aureus TaxID=193461 RepID=UPI0036278733